MDRRDFLSASVVTTTGVAFASGSAMLTGNSGLGTQTVAVDGQRSDGRVLIAESVAAQGLGGALPFALARFAEGGLMPAASNVPKALSPLRDVFFHGFATNAGPGALSADELRIVAVHTMQDGTVARHELWSHAPKKLGGTSPSVLFTAHDEVFSGFEVTHIPAGGGRSSAFFNFMGSGSGPQMKPGVYVLAGPRAATGLAPELGRYAYSGELRAPVRGSTLLGLDFPYVSFAVRGEWL